MYYVDNVMYPESGMEREETVYLYVRPYTGYARYAPLTETDRMVEKLVEIEADMKALTDAVGEAGRELAALRKDMNDFKSGRTADGRAVVELLEQLSMFSDAVEDGQQVQTERLDNILLALEEFKERF